DAAETARYVGAANFFYPVSGSRLHLPRTAPARRFGYNAPLAWRFPQPFKDNFPSRLMVNRFYESKSLDLPALEQDMLGVWEREATFARSIALRDGGPRFTFYEGPPTANGRPGIHHVLGRTIKDVFCRYKTLK